MIIVIMIIIINTSLLITEHIRPFMDIQPSDDALIFLNWGKQILPENVFWKKIYFGFLALPSCRRHPPIDRVCASFATEI